MCKTNENKPVEFKGYLINQVEETFQKADGTNVDVVKLQLVTKTKDSEGNIRDNFVEVKAYNGSLAENKNKLDIALSFLTETTSPFLTLNVFIGGNTYDYETKEGKKKVTIQKYFNTLSLAKYNGIAEVALRDKYVFEEDTEVPQQEIKKSLDSELMEFAKK